jgi:cellulose synthase/poly-beta-1,6-N-acetylglucosamine synthase-like glycosyltransferase
MTALWIAFVALYFLAGTAMLVQGGMQLTLLRAMRKAPTPPAQPIQLAGSLLVQLPLYNESAVVERLLEAIAGLRWTGGPLHIQILDDSTDNTPDLVAAWLNAHAEEHPARWSHLQRLDRSGYKAGALVAGLHAEPEADFVAIFDADFVPEPDFLECAAAALVGQPTAAAVQARWAHLNRYENALTTVQALNLDAHFTVEQGGRSALGGWAAFNGTAGIWRRTAIDEVGGWMGDTLAEDFDLSIRVQLAGWRVTYLEGLEAPAELPDHFGAYASQQHRWTAGGAGCARKHLGAIWRNYRGLRRRHALGQLFASSIHVPVWLMTTASVPLVAIEAWTGAFGWVLPTGAVFAAALLVLIVMYSEAHRRRGNAAGFPRQMLGMLLLGAGMTWRNLRSVRQGWIGRAGGFVRTPKGGMPATTAAQTGGAEWFWSLYFASGIALGAWVGEWGMLPFHALLAAGYAWVGQLARTS